MLKFELFPCLILLGFLFEFSASFIFLSDPKTLEKKEEEE